MPNCNRSVPCKTLVAAVIAGDIDKEHGKYRVLHDYNLLITFTSNVLIAIVNQFSHQLSEGVNNCLRID